VLLGQVFRKPAGLLGHTEALEQTLLLGIKRETLFGAETFQDVELKISVRKFFAVIGADIVGKRIGPVDIIKKSLNTCSQHVALILGPLVTVYETVTYTQNVGTRGLRFLQLSEMDVRFGEQS
jgi:hypothetical protein